MIERTVTIPNSLGLHARPAAQFVRMANKFGAEIAVAKDSVTVNGKSIMGVMMLAAEKGADVLIKATGEDADEAVAALVALIETGFGED